MRSDWKSLLLYAVLTYGITYAIYLLTKHLFGEEGSVHIEVLLPAFVLGMVMKHSHGASKSDERAATCFNMGIGMVIAMPAADAEKAIAILAKHGDKAQIIGKVIEGENEII